MSFVRSKLGQSIQWEWGGFEIPFSDGAEPLKFPNFLAVRDSINTQGLFIHKKSELRSAHKHGNISGFELLGFFSVSKEGGEGLEEFFSGNGVASKLSKGKPASQSAGGK